MPQKPPPPNPPPAKTGDCLQHRPEWRKFHGQPYWACGHARHTRLAKFSTSELYEMAARRELTPARIAEEMQQRDLECPACRVATSRRRHHWTLLFLVAAALFVLRIAACAPGAAP